MLRLSLFIGFSALFLGRVAFAADTPAATIDLTATFAPLIPIVLTFVGAALLAVGHRATKALQGMHLLQADAATDAAIETAVAKAEAWAVQQIAALPDVTVATHSKIAQDAAQMVRTILPLAISATPLDTAAIATRIRMALGDPTLGIATSVPVVPAPAPAGLFPPPTGLVLLALSGLTLVACANLTPVQKQELKVLGCRFDSVFQPMAVGTLSALVPGGTILTDIDTLVLHPDVVKYCANQGGNADTATPLPPGPVPASALLPPPVLPVTPAGQ